MPDFVTENANGTRAPAGRVSVDSGTVAIANAGQFPDDPTHPLPGVGSGWVATTSGYGDGGYDVLRVVDADGVVVGVEVVFISPTLEAASAHAVVAELGEGCTQEELFAYWDGTLDASTTRRVLQRMAAEQPITQRVWEEGLAGLHPVADATARLLGQIDISGQVGVGDPGYEVPSLELEVTPGIYDAVAWTFDAGEGWGTCVARLGIYRSGRGTATSRRALERLA